MYNSILEDLKYLSDHYYKYVIFSFEKLNIFYSSKEFIISELSTSKQIKDLLSNKLKNNTKLSLKATTKTQDNYNSEFDNWYEIAYYVNKNNKLMKDISFSYFYKDFELYNFDNYSSIVKDRIYLFRENESYSIEELIKIKDNLIFL